tara:strand:+ start:566 stop:1591 length:1026 start_codon:yes stop_codon:yes gene_type:complete
VKIAILSDNLDGHYNQSVGIAEILKDSLELSYTIIDVKLKNNFLRGLKYKLIKNLSRNLNESNIKIILSFFEVIDLTEFDLLISTGGKLTVLNAALAKKYNIKNIHNGSLRGIPDEYFSANLLLGEGFEKNSNNIKTILPPNRFNPLKHLRTNNKVLFLIGGDGSGYKYKKKDFFKLFNQIIKYSHDSGKIPLIVTSRRTKKSHEQLIKEYLQDYLDSHSVWFHSGIGRTNLSNIFKLVDEIFVTEDSSSMIAESISSGLHVYTIAPKRVKKNKDYLEMLHKYERMGFIKRLNFDSTFNKYTNKSIVSGKYKKIINAKHQLKIQILSKLKKLTLTRDVKTA